MVATNSIRAVCKKAVYDLIAEHAPSRADGTGPVAVFYGPTFRDLEDEVIWLGAIEGQMSNPTLAGGAPRVHRHDDFTLDVWIAVRNPIHDSYEESDTHCMTLVAAVEDAIVTSPGLTGARTTAIDGVIHATLGEFNGPSPFDLTDSGLGVFSAACLLKIEFRTRLT